MPPDRIPANHVAPAEFFLKTTLSYPRYYIRSRPISSFPSADSPPQLRKNCFKKEAAMNSSGVELFPKATDTTRA